MIEDHFLVVQGVGGTEVIIHCKNDNTENLSSIYV